METRISTADFAQVHSAMIANADELKPRAFSSSRYRPGNPLASMRSKQNLIGPDDRVTPEEAIFDKGTSPSQGR